MKPLELAVLSFLSVLHRRAGTCSNLSFKYSGGPGMVQDWSRGVFSSEKEFKE